MNKCRECGARSTEHCDRWGCPEPSLLSIAKKTVDDAIDALKLWQQTDARMNSPLDWDYADIKRRMQAINKPPYTQRSGLPNCHCDHCQKPIEERCYTFCDLAYRKRYGCEPEYPTRREPGENPTS